MKLCLSWNLFIVSFFFSVCGPLWAAVEAGLNGNIVGGGVLHANVRANAYFLVGTENFKIGPSLYGTQFHKDYSSYFGGWEYGSAIGSMSS